MPPVTLRDRRIWVGNTPYTLLSGEIHFWRLAPADWRPALRQAREMGLEIVTSYVCWEFHELASGRFDFTGATDPRRDLVGFIELVADEGLKLLIRPGPYIYGEWPNGGVPDRCAVLHRTHPQFRREARVYIAAVSEVLKPYLATAGGPVLMLQAENEPHPWPHIYEHQLGLGTEPGPFQTFLQARYGTIEALNAAWESDLPGFAAARAVTRPGIETRAYQNRHLDYVRFQHAYSAEAVAWTADQYRAAGIDVPIFANVYVGESIQNWRDTEAACDLVGPDLYPTSEFQGGAEEVIKTFLHPLRYTRSYSALPCIPEFEAGIWHGGQYEIGALTASHYRLAGCLALLAGVAGWNWYMLVNRDNWLMSPIDERGRPQPDLYPAFRALVRVFREIDPPNLTKLTATAVTVDLLYQTAGADERGFAVLKALHDAGIDHECFDVETGRLARPLLFYAGGPWLSRAGQERLLAYVEAGGSLVYFQQGPRLDDALSPLNLLEIPAPTRILSASAPQRLAIQLGDERVIASPPAFFIYDDPLPGDPILAERIAEEPGEGSVLALHIALPVGTRYTVGVRRTHGAGQLICLGLPPDPALVTALHRWLGVPIFSQAAGIQTALFERDGVYTLVAANLGTEAHTAAVQLHPDLFAAREWVARDLFSGAILPANLSQDGRLVLHLDRKSGTVARIEPQSSPV